VNALLEYTLGPAWLYAFLWLLFLGFEPSPLHPSTWERTRHADYQ
jgi:hypothetical protein